MLDFVGTEIIEIRRQCFLHEYREPTDTPSLCQGTQRLVLFGCDLYRRAHACMLTRAFGDKHCQ